MIELMDYRNESGCSMIATSQSWRNDIAVNRKLVKDWKLKIEAWEMLPWVDWQHPSMRASGLAKFSLFSTSYKQNSTANLVL
jgi:hypothetical protein